MELKRGKVTKFKSLNPSGSSLEKDLVRRASREDSWRNTIYSMEGYLNAPEKFLNTDFLESIASFFSEETSDVGKSLRNVNSIVDEVYQNVTNLEQSMDNDSVRIVDDALQLRKLKGLKDLITASKVERHAIDAFILSKVCTLIAGNLKKILEVVNTAAEHNMITQEVIDELQNIGLSSKVEVKEKKLNIKSHNIKPVTKEKKESIFTKTVEKESEPARKGFSEYGYFGSGRGSSSIFGGGSRLGGSGRRTSSIFDSGASGKSSSFGSGRKKGFGGIQSSSPISSGSSKFKNPFNN